MKVTKVYSGIKVTFDIKDKSDLKINDVVYEISSIYKGNVYYYIGQSSYGILNRINSHCNSNSKENSKKAIVIKNTKDISVKIIKQCNNKFDLDRSEREYIKLYIKNYGERCLNFVLSSSNTDDIKKYRDSNKSIPIKQYTLEGKFLNSYASIREAARILNVPKANIQKAVNGKLYTAYGFQWKKSSDNSKACVVVPPCSRISGRVMEKLDKIDCKNGNKIEGTISKKKREQEQRGRKVVQYDLDGTKINVFPSIREAALKCKVNVKSVENCCNGVYIESNGSQFRFLNGNHIPVNHGIKPKRERTKDTNIKTKGHKIIQYDMNMNEIKRYDSINQAKIENGYSNLQYYVTNQKPYGGFIWKLA